MRELSIAATKNSPMVHFDLESHRLIVRGVSTMADAKAFYQPIIDWLNENEIELSTHTVFELHLPYFNSGSNKCLYYLIEAVKQHNERGNQYSVIWCVEEDDEFMREGGEAIAELHEMKFEYKQVPFNSERLF